MLAHALPEAGVSYREGVAENVPCPDGHFDLVSVGIAFHWFDAEGFFAEASRVLTPAGWLVIYNSGFTGQVYKAPAVARWFREEFLNRYPTPPRNRSSITASVAEAHALSLVGEEPLSNDIEMGVDEFIDYELSTTNVIAAVRNGASIDAAESWMRETLTPTLEGRRAGTFCFAGRVWYLQKQAA